MAKLTSCKDCGHKVSKSASTCPQCGTPKPGVKTVSGWTFLITLGLLFAGINWLYSSLFPNAQTQPGTIAQKTGLVWDIEGEADFSAAEKALIEAGALKVLADEGNCASIYTGYRSSSQQGAYYVTCTAMNGREDFNVWFTPEELTSSGSLALPEPYPEQQSREGCNSAIESFVMNPSTLDIHSLLGYSSNVGNNGKRAITQEFSAKNLLGLELEYVARCLILPDGTLEFSASEKANN